MPVSSEVATLFLDEMKRRNVPVTLGPNGEYHVESGTTRLTVSLENLSRDFERDRDVGRIASFVDSVTRQLDEPNWEAARPRVRWSPESRDMRLDENALFDIVSDQVALVLVLVSSSETEIQWVSPALAGRWGQTKASLFAAATENMHRLLAEAAIEAEPLEQFQLGMLSTEYTAFKAALVFCPGLKEAAEPTLGWPLLAVMPCRDFVYLIRDQDRDLLGRLGPTVVREHAESGYPLSTEVFELTDAGVRAVGAFQPGPTAAAAEEPTDGLKTIRYRGGVVTFRIPEDWEEEYEDEGGGTFYPDYDDSGTLRLSLLLFKTAEPVTNHTARERAEWRLTKEEGAKAAALADGNWMVTYTHQTEEGGDDLTVHYWELLNPVPPNHLRMAVFSFTGLTDRLEDPDGDVSQDLRLLEQLIPACQFAREIGE